MKAVHKHAGGVPRLVNIICDRALLGAYSQGLRQVTPEIVHKAAEEALGKPVASPRRPRGCMWRICPRRPNGWRR